MTNRFNVPHVTIFMQDMIPKPKSRPPKDQCVVILIDIDWIRNIYLMILFTLNNRKIK